MQESIPSEKDIWFWQKIWRVTYYMILLKLESSNGFPENDARHISSIFM